VTASIQDAIVSDLSPAWKSSPRLPTGPSAVRLARHRRPDVILMDVSMPRLNGVEARRIIHEEMPEVRVIELSMHEEPERAVATRQAGAVDYLSKRRAADVLTKAIRACVANPERVANESLQQTA